MKSWSLKLAISDYDDDDDDDDDNDYGYDDCYYSSIIVVNVVALYDQQMIFSDEPNNISGKGSNFQETAVVETKSILGAANLIHRSQLFIYS